MAVPNLCRHLASAPPLVTAACLQVVSGRVSGVQPQILTDTPVHHPPTPWSLLKHASEIAQSWQARGPASGQASHRLGVFVAWTRGRPQLTGWLTGWLAGWR